MNVNNKLYRAYFNQKPLMQQPKKEEKKAEEQGAPLIKASEAKPVTASLADIVAEMNKSMVVNSGAKGAGIEEKVAESGDEQFVKYCELMQRLNSLRPESQEYRETVEALLALAESFAQNNPTSVDADWEAAIERWRGILEGLGREGGRGANGNSGPAKAALEEDLVIDRSGGANLIDETISNVTMDELLDASNQVWNKVQELLDEHNMDYDVSIFGNILDGQENFENNIRYQNILYELGQQLSNQELTELQILVLKFEKMLSDYHAINPDYPLDKIKHSVFHGIAPFILAPNGLY